MTMPDSATPLAATLTSERERWVLWVPVALLARISSYFTLPFEPWPFAGLAITLVGLLLTLLPYRTPGVRLFFLTVMFCGVGFALVQWETARSDGPILRSEVGPRMVSGTISIVEPRDKGVRLTLDDPVIDWLEPEETPRRIRITVRTHGGIEPVPGQSVRILAMLDAPPPPTFPGGFDFAREAFFDSIGGVGFAVGPLQHAEGVEPKVSWIRSALLVVERTRLAATDQILEALPEPTGGVAAAPASTSSTGTSSGAAPVASGFGFGSVRPPLGSGGDAGASAAAAAAPAAASGTGFGFGSVRPPLGSNDGSAGTQAAAPAADSNASSASVFGAVRPPISPAGTPWATGSSASVFGSVKPPISTTGNVCV